MPVFPKSSNSDEKAAVSSGDMSGSSGTTQDTTTVRPTGSAGYTSISGAASIGDLNRSERRLGTGSGGTVSAPGYSAGQSADVLGNLGTGNNEAPSEVALSKEEADRLYEERMEEEYAKREGGA